MPTTALRMAVRFSSASRSARHGGTHSVQCRHLHLPRGGNSACTGQRVHPGQCARRKKIVVLIRALGEDDLDRRFHLARELNRICHRVVFERPPGRPSDRHRIERHVDSLIGRSCRRCSGEAGRLRRRPDLETAAVEACRRAQRLKRQMLAGRDEISCGERTRSPPDGVIISSTESRCAPSPQALLEQG